ncbi:hypothetical protein K443DRAFT_683827, partial [Laccaria amethystina LaAM-08-1]
MFKLCTQFGLVTFFSCLTLLVCIRDTIFLIIITPIGGLQDVLWIVRWDRGFLVGFQGGGGVWTSSSLPLAASRTCCGLRGVTEVRSADSSSTSSISMEGCRGCGAGFAGSFWV